jgi:hypothetical protein
MYPIAIGNPLKTSAVRNFYIDTDYSTCVGYNIALDSNRIIPL